MENQTHFTLISLMKNVFGHSWFDAGLFFDKVVGMIHTPRKFLAFKLIVGFSISELNVMSLSNGNA